MHAGASGNSSNHDVSSSESSDSSFSSSNNVRVRPIQEASSHSNPAVLQVSSLVYSATSSSWLKHDASVVRFAVKVVLSADNVIVIVSESLSVSVIVFTSLVYVKFSVS